MVGGDRSFSITHSERDGRHLVVIGGELDLNTAPELREALLALIQEGTTSLTFDVAGVDFIDSTAIGVLIGAFRRAKAMHDDAAWEFTGLNGRVRKVFELTGLGRVFKLVE